MLVPAPGLSLKGYAFGSIPNRSCAFVTRIRILVNSQKVALGRIL